MVERKKKRAGKIKVRLTRDLIAQAAYEEYGGKSYETKSGKQVWKKIILWDDKTQGLGVRLLPSGKKTFILWYRNQKRQEKLLTLGDCRTLSLPQARALARTKRADVDTGGDPLEEKVLQSRSTTFEEAAAKYMEHYGHRKKSVRDDRGRLKNHLLPEFGHKPMVQISRSDVAAFHERLGQEKPYEANRNLSLISMIFKKAQLWGLIPIELRNPAEGVSKFPEKKRTRVLNLGEAARLIRAIDAEQDPRIRLAIRMYLYLGVRKGELLKLRWEDIDTERRIITFYDTKNGEDHQLRPPDEVFDLLAEAHNQRLPEADYVFWNDRDSTYLKDIRKPWNRIREKAGLTDITLHDLRRSVATWLGEMNFGSHSIKKVLNHKNIATSERYVNLAAMQTEEPLRRIGERVQEAERLAKESVSDESGGR